MLSHLRRYRAAIEENDPDPDGPEDGCFSYLVGLLILAMLFWILSKLRGALG